MDGLDVSQLSSASAKGPDPRGGSSRRMARTSCRLGRRPGSCRAGSKARGRRATVSTSELCGIDGSIGVASAL